MVIVRPDPLDLADRRTDALSTRLSLLQRRKPPGRQRRTGEL